ncbi:hypothetical protein FRC02_011791 [Tulasnella sp. 418]|nr:hypothetical protein FRC02_011791 [Tulasnella sp. 418]
MQEMRLENQELGLENVDVDDDPLEPEEEHENDAIESRKPDPESGNALSPYMSENDNDFTGAMSSKKRKKKGKKGVTVDATAGNDDVDPNGLLDARRNQGGEEVQHQEDVKASVEDEAPESVSKPPELSKREKRRAKELAKKEKRADQICNVCHEEFESRTKLFLHVRETGHAAPQPDNKTQDDLPAKGEQHKTRGGKKSRK